MGGSFLRSREYQKYLLNIVALYKQRPDLKAYLELLLSLITVIFFIVFALKPTTVTIIGLLNKIKSLEDTNNQLQTKIDNLRTAQNFYNLNQDKILLLSLAVPNGPQVQSYVRQFEGVTAKNKLKTISTSIDEVKLNQATESGAISVLSTQSGSYTDLVQYVKDLENMRRPSYAARLDLLTVTSDGKKSLNITTNLKVPYILTQ